MARHASQPSLKANKFGYFEIRWSDNGRSKRISTGTVDQEKAQKFFGAWLIKNGDMSDHKWNVGELLEAYFDEKIVGGPTEERTLIIVATLARAFGGRDPQTLDAGEILRYTRERAEGLHGRRKACGSTVRRELTVLIAALNHAVRQRRIKREQFPHIDRPEDGEARGVVISPDHMELIMGAATGKLLSFITIAYETAQRRAAVENLKWLQVGRASRFIDFTMSGGSGAKGGVVVPISDRLMAHLESLPRAESRNDFVLGNNHSVYPSWVALMDALAKETGCDDFIGYNPHDLRRTWATRAAQRGVDLWSIAGILGDSLAVVTKHYARHQPEHLRHAVS